jgi:hypothetical protein
MAQDSSLESLRDVASKAAENAARIAGVLTIVADAEASTIDANAMRAACELMTWYLGEASRLSGLHRLPPALRDAIRLLDWLRVKRKKEVTRSQIMQFGPAPLRMKAAADAAMTVLEEHGHAVRIDGKGARWTVMVEVTE